MSSKTDTATLGGGCFWCLDAVYRGLKGVTKVESGYAGGHAPEPTYEQVCRGVTGHAEVVQVTYDPDEISYRDILEVFFTIHDPTTLNRQGADVGTQYRSIVLYHDKEQKKVAQEVVKGFTAEGLFDDPIVTELAPLDEYFPAEEHHQDYFARNPRQPYCAAVVAPKVAKFRAKWAKRLKAEA